MIQKARTMLLGKSRDDRRPNSCPEIRVAAVVSPLSHRHMEAREELCYIRPDYLQPGHASLSDGDLKHNSMIPPPLSISKLRRGKQITELTNGQLIAGRQSKRLSGITHEIHDNDSIQPLDTSHVTLSPQPPDEENIERRKDAEYFAEKIAQFYGFDVVYVASIDSTLLEQARPNAFATVLVAYTVPGVSLPRLVPTALYRMPVEEDGWIHDFEALPSDFQSGYRRLFDGKSVKYVFMCFARPRARYSDRESITLFEDAEWLAQAVTSRPFWI
ncbi:hypothetical protein IWW34DRAFT_885860 [Fusarium oxysporum f. sp. albedinis]|nr:hypothetical protein IWW34DRAFT_885860 [Fusarium oxysporum f. sp. albedinis]